MRLQKNQVLSLDQLDELLDLPVSAFDKAVRKLVRDFRSKNVQVDVQELGRGSTDERVTWTGMYEAEVRALPPMERREEFLMAKRHEFLRERVREGLLAAGFATEDLDELLKLSSEQLPASPKRRSMRYVKVAVDQLHALRRRYVEGALYLVTGVAFRYRGLGVDLVDLVQEGNASLFQAVDNFDWRRDVRFKTYAQYWVQQAVLKTLYNSSRTVRVPVWVQKALHKIQKLRQQSDPDQAEAQTLHAIAKEMEIPVERIEELMATRRYAVSLDAELPGEDGASLSTFLPDDQQEAVIDQVEDGNLNERLGEVLGELPERERDILARRYGLDGREPETLAEIADDLGVSAERVRQLQNAALGRLQRPGSKRRLAGLV